MTTVYEIPLQNGTHDFDIAGAAPGIHPLIFSYDTKPTAGRLAVFVRYGPGEEWWPVIEAQNIDMRASAMVMAWGAVDAYRFVISGLAGGAGLRVRIDDSDVWTGPGFPAGIFEGLRAMTVQQYTEANVKKGVQYQVGAYIPALPASPTPGAGFADYIVITGDKPVSIKGRHFQFDGFGIQLETYRAPTYTGGVPVEYFNLNDENPVAGAMQIIGAPTVSIVGTRCFPTRTFLGSTGQGNSVLQSAAIEAQGLEFILKRNTAYLFRTISLNTSGTQRMASYNTWYEGELDLPRN